MTLGLVAVALAAPWIFLGIAEMWPTALWDSPKAARTGGTQITRILLYASMIVVPVAAAAYGALAPRRRFWKVALGGLVGVALWVANLLCFEAAVTPGNLG